MIVQKQLICLEDLQLGTGSIVQDRNGASYALYKIDLVPSVNSVEDLAYLQGYTKAKVGLVNYKSTPSGWVVDPIPQAAFEALGEAASRGTTGPGNLLNAGFAGIGGPALTGATGLAVGLQASVADGTVEGAPVEELCVVLTLPGLTENVAQFAVSSVTGDVYVRRVGSAWRKVALVGDSVNFAALKADSVRANSVGTPKE